jgi:monofunctional biosynthetic peptidoglycan transglycosylase
MGGRSASALTGGKGEVAVFQGNLSLEDNGGFASVRRQIPAGTLEGASAIVLRVRGDGRPYQLRLRPDQRFDGIAYAADFGTAAGQWITVELPLHLFEPTFRGYRPPGVGPLEPSRIGQVGVMLADKREGPFRLEIEWIGVDRSAPLE